MDSVPMVAITGNVTRNLLGLDSFQEVDICGITMPVTKHNFIVKEPEKLPDIIREAFRIANEGRKGPVLIDIPKDITAAMIEYEKKEPLKSEYKDPDTFEAEIAEAAELIKKCERPFIYAGGGVVSADAVDEMKEFVRKCNAPVALSLMGQCAYDNTSENYIGMLGMHGTKAAAKAVSGCDLMIVLGSRFSDRVLCNPNTFAKNAHIIHIEIDPAEIGKNIEVYHHVTGDVRKAIARLNELLPDMSHPEWFEEVMGWKKKYALRMVPIENEDEVLPDQVISKLDELTDGKAIISTEVGQHQMWAAQYYDFKCARSFASSGGLGTMGYGLGAAIGCKVGNPDRTVVNIAGDGSFFMNCNELSSLAKHKLPLIELVFENDVLGMVRQWQRLFYGKRFSQTNIERGTDFMKLAEAFGIEGVRITKKDEIEPQLKKALEYAAAGRPVLVDVVINKDINVLPMVPAGADVSQPIMEIDLES
jgi:acetolactate synthase-1/2/3 large subunit